jgi:hypothetical protein
MKKVFINSLLLLSLSVGILSSHILGQQNGQTRQLSHPGEVEARQNKQRRLALVIGNSNYRNAPRLNNPVNDAHDIASALRGLGFEVIVGEDQTAEKMKRLILSFGERLRQGGGVGLFYYAGHGVQIGGRNYLIPVEASSLREQTIEFDAVDVGRVLAEMDAAGNGFNIVILDACRSNPFAQNRRSGETGLAQIIAPEGTLIAYATSPGKVADDGEGRNGVYTAELLKQMRVPEQKVEAMFKAVRVGVIVLTGRRQVPWESSSLVGDFYFADKAVNYNGRSSATNGTPYSNTDRLSISSPGNTSSTASSSNVNHSQMTVKVKNLRFILRQCELSDSVIDCHLQVANDGEERKLQIETGPEVEGSLPIPIKTQILDGLGRNYYTEGTERAYQGKSANYMVTLKSGSTEQITLRFVNVSPAVTSVKSLAIGWWLSEKGMPGFGITSQREIVTSQREIVFRDVPLVVADKANRASDPLKGIKWLGHGMTINQLPVFLEFEPGGAVRTSTPGNMTGYVAGNVSWFRSGDTIFVLYFKNGLKQVLETQFEGQIKGNRIEGTGKDVKTRVTFPWILTKVDE